MKIKDVIRILLGASLIAYLLYSTFSFYGEQIAEPARRSGLITWKASIQEVIKHSSSVEFIFVVDFDKTGKEDVYVNASTYSSYSVGDRVTLPIRKMIGLNSMPAIITLILLGVFCIVMIVATILWIITGEWSLRI